MDPIKTHLPTRLLATAEEFLRRRDNGQSLPDLAREVLGDRAYFTRLRGSTRGIHSRSYDRFQAHFVAHGHDPDELAQAGAARSRTAQVGSAKSGVAQVGTTLPGTADPAPGEDRAGDGGAAGSGQVVSGDADHDNRVPATPAPRTAQSSENCA